MLLVSGVIFKCQVKSVDCVVEVCSVFADFQPTYVFRVMEKEVMKYLSIIMGFSISPCSSINFCFIYFEALIRCIDI